MQTILTIAGTHCRACQTLLEEVASEQPGVQTCSVDFTTGHTVIEHDVGFNPAEFARAVNELGPYQLNLI